MANATVLESEYGIKQPQRFNAALAVHDDQAVPSMLAGHDGGWVQVEDYEALRSTLERLFSQDCIDDGDGALMVPSEVEPDRLVPDFESGLKAAMKLAAGGTNS